MSCGVTFKWKFIHGLLFFLSVKWIITFRCNTVDYALPCVKPNQTGQIKPSAFGREEGSHWVMLHWPGGQPVSAWSNCPCMEQAKLGATKQEWYLGLSSELATTVKKALEFLYSQWNLCHCVFGAVHPPQSLYGAGISWFLLPVGCTFFFFFLFSCMVRPWRICRVWIKASRTIFWENSCLGLNCFWPVLNVKCFQQRIKGMSVICCLQLSSNPGVICTFPALTSGIWKAHGMSTAEQENKTAENFWGRFLGSAIHQSSLCHALPSSPRSLER